MMEEHDWGDPLIKDDCLFGDYLDGETIAAVAKTPESPLIEFDVVGLSANHRFQNHNGIVTHNHASTTNNGFSFDDLSMIPTSTLFGCHQTNNGGDRDGENGGDGIEVGVGGEGLSSQQQQKKQQIAVQPPDANLSPTDTNPGIPNFHTKERTTAFSSSGGQSPAELGGGQQQQISTNDQPAFSSGSMPQQDDMGSSQPIMSDDQTAFPQHQHQHEQQQPEQQQQLLAGIVMNPKDQQCGPVVGVAADHHVGVAADHRLACIYQQQQSQNQSSFFNAQRTTNKLNTYHYHQQHHQHQLGRASAPFHHHQQQQEQLVYNDAFSFINPQPSLLSFNDGITNGDHHHQHQYHSHHHNLQQDLGSSGSGSSSHNGSDAGSSTAGSVHSNLLLPSPTNTNAMNTANLLAPSSGDNHHIPPPPPTATTILSSTANIKQEYDDCSGAGSILHNYRPTFTMSQQTQLAAANEQQLLLHSPYEYGNLNGPIISTNGQVKVLQKGNGLESAVAAATSGGMTINRPRLLITTTNHGLPTTSSIKMIRQRQQQQKFDNSRMDASPSPPSSDGSAPETPAFGPLRNRSKMHELALQQRLITEQDPRGNGEVLLSAEEKRTLMQEGYPVPSTLPLNKQEEESLKIVRRKIKNKLSAQESRRKRKEYMETLEQRVQIYYSENATLRQRIKQLEGNRSLGGQLKKIQQQQTATVTAADQPEPAVVDDINNRPVDTVDPSSFNKAGDNNKPKSVSIATQTSVCLTALIVLFAVCMPILPTGLFPFDSIASNNPLIIQHREDSPPAPQFFPDDSMMNEDKKYHRNPPDSQPFDHLYHQNIPFLNHYHQHYHHEPERENGGGSPITASVTSRPSRVLVSSCENKPRPIRDLPSPNQPTEPTAITGTNFDQSEARLLLQNEQLQQHSSLPNQRKHEAMADVRNEQDELTSLWMADSTTRIRSTVVHTKTNNNNNKNGASLPLSPPMMMKDDRTGQNTRERDDKKMLKELDAGGANQSHRQQIAPIAA